MISLHKGIEEILQHHGVKGMHWGKHKAKVESAEVTKAKSEVAKRKAEHKTANKQYRKESVVTAASKETAKKLNSASRELRYAKEDLSSVKILNKINSKPKSEYQLKMEEKYKKQGMSNDEAAVAAYKNIRFKKVAAVAAITTLAIAGTVAGVKIKNAHVDKIIKSGATLQNITHESDKGIRDAFYSAKHGLDKSKYKGLYGRHLHAKHGEAFKKEIKVLTDIKQASPKNAHKVLDELFKTDKEFAQGVKDIMAYDKVHANFGDVYSKKVLRSKGILNGGKVNKDIYEVFNASLVDHSPEMQKLTDRYFKALSEKGYNAIKDVNDSKYSGYKSLNPIIAFNSKGKVDVVDVKKLTEKEIAKHGNIAMAHLAAGPIAAQGAMIAASMTGSMAAANYATKKVSNKRVTKYRQANPKTKLTNTQIARMLERGA
jgi:hypothetical protein